MDLQSAMKIGSDVVWTADCPVVRRKTDPLCCPVSAKQAGLAPATPGQAHITIAPPAGRSAGHRLPVGSAVFSGAFVWWRRGGCGRLMRIQSIEFQHYKAFERFQIWNE